MRKFVSLFVFLTAIFVCTPCAIADDPKAQEILKQARAALGGEDLLSKLEALTIKGQYRRVLGDRQMGGERELSFQMPDKYLVEDSFNPGGLSTAMINTRGLNGEQAWSSSSGGGGGMVFRVAGPGGQQMTPEQMEAALRRVYRLEMTRYLIALVLSSPPSMSLEYKYLGPSEVEELTAEVLEVTGPDKFSARIFFDQKSHLPLLLSYRGPKPRIMTMTRPSGGHTPSPDDVKKAREEAEKKLASEPVAQPEEVDFFIRVTDHKKVNGLLLPFKFTFLTDSEVSEEFEISKYQINPQFKADKFQK